MATDPETRRVSELRELATTDPVAARTRARAWLLNLIRPEPIDIPTTTERVTRVFRAGQAVALNGYYRATLSAELPAVAARLPLLGPQLELGTRITDRWPPLRGKHFNAESGRGVEVMGPIVGRILGAATGNSPHVDGRALGEFTSTIEPSVGDPEIRVLALDHDDLIADIRDEIVEIVPGVALLRVYARIPVLNIWTRVPVVELLTAAEGATANEDPVSAFTTVG
jgi:hypothetical protein